MRRENPRAVLAGGGLHVYAGGVESQPRLFVDMAPAARLVAGLTWEGGAWDLDPSCRAPRAWARWFDADAFEAMVEEESRALRAGNGWRVHATAGDYTFWTSLGTFQVTKGEVPGGYGGYGRIDYLLRAKNLHPHQVVPAQGHGADVRAVADAAGGWAAMARERESWLRADGESHPTPEAARAAAVSALARGLPGPDPEPAMMSA